tara:strand:+ start:1122 stop:1772 length:651 start_codon:yes stop_codon:yes gene_type:complete
MRLVLAIFLSLTWASASFGYGYTREADPLLKSFQAAIRAARQGDFPAAEAEAKKVSWQLDELRDPKDLGVDFRAAFAKAHAKPTEKGVVEAWVNLVYLAFLQKLHWNTREKLADYHKARPRLEAAIAYYELAFAGNLRLDDEARRKKDPKAPSRHADVVAQLKAAKTALGSPGLFGAGKRAPDLEAFQAASLRIAGHLNAVFPSFVRPKRKRPSGG